MAGKAADSPMPSVNMFLPDTYDDAEVVEVDEVEDAQTEEESFEGGMQ